MVENLFFEIGEDKRKKIIRAALEEFSENGFELCSTNKIVKKAGISKGSLFKYFKTKENLYFFLIDRIVQRLGDEMIELPDELFQRIMKYAEYEFDFYLKNPVEYTFIKRAFFDNGSKTTKKTLEKYTDISESSFYQLCNTADLDITEKKEFTDILKWVLKGFNDEFFRANKDRSPKELKILYTNMLERYLSILKKCMEA